MTNKFYIKERYNPQLGTYHVPCGQMSKTAAKKLEFTIYGDNIMRAYDTEADYLAQIAELKKRKERVQ